MSQLHSKKIKVHHDHIAQLEKHLNTTFRETHNSFNANCPFCHKRGKSADTKKHFYIYKDSGLVLCYRCGYKTSFTRLLSTYEPNKFGMFSLSSSVPHDSCVDSSNRSNSVPLTLETAYPLVSPNSAAWEYLKKRQLSDEEIRKFEFRDDQLQKRIAIPIKENKQFLGFAYRFYDGSARRHLFDRSFEKSKHMFNYDQAVGASEIIVCEGIFSAISAGRQGVPAVATFGKTCSDTQLFKLVATGAKRLYVAYEWDDLENVFHQAKKFCNFFDVYIVNMPYKVKEGVGIQYLDPNDVPCFNYRDASPFSPDFFVKIKTKLAIEKFKSGIMT